MTKVTITITACAMLLYAGMALAAFTPSPQQNCDSARITAWKVYTSCVEAVVAKNAKGVTFDEFKSFWKCRHAYFKKWQGFAASKYATSTCQTGPGNPRFTVTDSGATVTDTLTGLAWELKTNSGVHNGSDFYTWGTGSNTQNGTAFTTFLTTDLNTPGFAGANGWRMPTLAELQTIQADFPCVGTGGSGTCVCPSSPGTSCVAFSDSNTQATYYWAALSYLPTGALPSAWIVDFGLGDVRGPYTQTDLFPVRAVRGGL